MKKYGIIVYNSGRISSVLRSLQLDFKVTYCQSVDSLLEHASLKHDDLVLIDVLDSVSLQYDILELIKTKHKESFAGLSVVLLIDQISLEKRLKVCELGADDCITNLIAHDDLVARIQSTIFHVIADKQLKNKFDFASEISMAAMTKTDDLSITMRFFKDSFQCGNLDQLGQLLFKVLNYYGLKCSLQMRSKFYVKNMEANGMERAMESKLLCGLKDYGSVYEFGRRAVINEGCVSLLIKNMPEELQENKSIIYYTVITLLKGVSARLQLLDRKIAALGEHDIRSDLGGGCASQRGEVDDRYRNVANEVSAFLDKLFKTNISAEQELFLSEHQESVLFGLLKKGRNNVMRVIERESLTEKNSK